MTPPGRSATVGRHAAGAVLALLLAMVAPLTAQPSPQQGASDLSRQLMSPFCPGKLLADCTSPAAGELRTVIRTRLEAGDTIAAVKSDLVREYGRAILGAPEATGIGLLAWLLPALLGLVTAAAIGMKVAHATRETLAARVDPAPAVAGIDAATRARLDDELRDLD